MNLAQKLSLSGRTNGHETTVQYPLYHYAGTDLLPVAGWVFPKHPSSDIAENGIVVFSSIFGQRFSRKDSKLVISETHPASVFDCKIGVDFYYEPGKVFSTPENPRQRVYLKLVKIENDANPAKEFFSFETHADNPMHQKLYSEADYEADSENLVFIGYCNGIYSGMVLVTVDCGQRNLSVV